MATPYISWLDPAKNSTISTIDSVEFNIIDLDGNLRLDTMQIHIQNTIAYDGPTNRFYSPFNNINSLYSPIADGYYFKFTNDVAYTDGLVTFRLSASDTTLNTYYNSWAYWVGTSLNRIYYSDGYGIKAIDICYVAGESQDQVKTILSTTTYPTLPSNAVTSIIGNNLDGYGFYLVSSDDNANGTQIIKNEVDDLKTYSSGNTTTKGQINDRGILYLINKDNNTIEVYYGAHFRGDTTRAPDFVYSTTSKPKIISGEILELYVISGYSSTYSNIGSRICVGTENGMTRIEAYDKESPDGYQSFAYPGVPWDEYGLAVNYIVVGGVVETVLPSSTYEIIGGTISRVTKIASNVDETVLFVITNDGAGEGGLTQIKIAGNKKLLFMTKEMGLLPSNNLRDCCKNS